MKSTIHILPEQLCNKIAAGEVVERPASVAKELLENALDAGATEIRIEVLRGGKGLIRITDDGTGMSRDDVFLCLERHATSKIRTDDDLFRLRTLGFRGEALPSIASVSRLCVRSRTEDSLEGWEICAEGGKVKKSTAVGMPRGTCVEIRDLFFNTPARRKFLRRDETELGHIADVVTRMAVARPDVRFGLNSEGRSLLEVYAEEGLMQRVAGLLGRPLARDLLELESRTEGMSLRGLIAAPQASRSSTGSMYAYINGRYIRDRVFQHAVLEGYRHLLEKGRYPVTVLFLEIDPEMVDVNVHPTKHEVRFRDQGRVHDFIAEAVRRVLRPSAWVGGPVPHDDSAAADHRPAPTPRLESVRLPQEEHSQRVREALQSYGQTVLERRPSPPVRSLRSPETKEPELPRSEAPKAFFSSLRVIGQFRGSYIVAQDGDDLLLIDQHAAHERIGFERLRSQYREGRLERQSLLFPRVLEFDHREAESLMRQKSELERLGFELDPFGGKTFALKTVPILLVETLDPERLLRDVAEDLSAIGKSSRMEEAIEQVLIRMACHRVIRANQPLAIPQMTALLSELDTVNFSGNCPHGRPVLKRLGLAEIERMFRRT
jgi:DNA mismatch repair protein MutL